MATTKEEREGFATSFWMNFGAACLFFGFLINLGVMMAVMTISVALPLHILKLSA